SDDDLSHFDDDAYQSDASTATTATVASTAYQQYSNSRPVRQNLPNSVHFTIPNRPTRVGVNQDSQADQIDGTTNEDLAVEANEQNVGETFFLGHKYTAPLLTRKRVVFSAGLILGLIIAWLSMEPTTV